MTFPLVRTAALALAIVLLPGCAMLRKRTETRRLVAMEKNQAEAKKRPTLVGRISLVNTDSRFVLIDEATTQPPEGTTLRAFADGVMSGELRATGVRRRPFVIADIVSGTPGKGDVVMTPAQVEPPKPPRAEAARKDVPTPPAQPFPFWKRWMLRLGLGH